MQNIDVITDKAQSADTAVKQCCKGLGKRLGKRLRGEFCEKILRKKEAMIKSGMNEMREPNEEDRRRCHEREKPCKQGRISHTGFDVRVAFCRERRKKFKNS
jgi:hypothetical protein